MATADDSRSRFEAIKAAKDEATQRAEAAALANDERAKEFNQRVDDQFYPVFRSKAASFHTDANPARLDDRRIIYRNHVVWYGAGWNQTLISLEEKKYLIESEQEQTRGNYAFVGLKKLIRSPGHSTIRSTAIRTEALRELSGMPARWGRVRYHETKTYGQPYEGSVSENRRVTLLVDRIKRLEPTVQPQTVEKTH